MSPEPRSALAALIATVKGIFLAGLAGGSWQPVAALRARIPADLARERYEVSGIRIEPDEPDRDHVITSTGRNLLAREAVAQLVGSGLCERSGQGYGQQLRLCPPAPVTSETAPPDDSPAADRPGGHEPVAVAETVRHAERRAAAARVPAVPDRREIPCHEVTGLFPLLEGPEYEARNRSFGSVSSTPEVAAAPGGVHLGKIG